MARKKTKKPEVDTSVVGDVISQFMGIGNLTFTNTELMSELKDYCKRKKKPVPSAIQIGKAMKAHNIKSKRERVYIITGMA